MSFFRKQRIITLVSRLGFFLILFFSFTTARFPALFHLSSAGTAALFALAISLPIGHASSFWYMTTSNLTFLAFIYAVCDLIIRNFSWYGTWRKFTLDGFFTIALCAVYILAGLIVAKSIRKSVIPSPQRIRFRTADCVSCSFPIFTLGGCRPKLSWHGSTA